VKENKRGEEKGWSSSVYPVLEETRLLSARLLPNPLQTEGCAWRAGWLSLNSGHGGCRAEGRAPTECFISWRALVVGLLSAPIQFISRGSVDWFCQADHKFALRNNILRAP